MNQVIKKQDFSVAIIEKKKAVLELPEVEEGLTRGELRVAKLSANTSIRNMPDRDLRIIGNEEKDFGLVAKVGILAKGIAKDFSIRNVEKTEAFRFLDILKKYYSEFTLEEVRTAFELALVGELDSYLPKDKNGVPDKNHYQVFSLEFVTKILNAFKSYKGKVWKKVYMIEAKVEPVVTEEQKAEAEANFLFYVQDVFESYCRGEGLVTLFPIVLKEHFIKEGLIEDRELTDKDYERARINIITNKNINPFEQASILEAVKNGNKSKLESEAERIKAEELIIIAFEKLKGKKA